MSLLFCLLCVFVATVSAQTYDPRRCSVPKHYSELGCTPIHDNNSYCPTRFNCDLLTKRDHNKCYYKGVAYELNEGLNDDPENPCAIGCTCVEGYEEEPLMWSCAEVDCPEDFGNLHYDDDYEEDDINRECYLRHSLDDCCAKRYCFPDARDAEQKPLPAQCEYNGKTYLEGQNIDSDLPCSSCICQAGFNGTLDGPWCRGISCGIELHDSADINEGCVPIYYGQPTCCPIGRRCPEAQDSIVRSKPATFRNTRHRCKFGNLNLKIGDQLSPTSNKCVECSCSLPPFVTCIQKRNEECNN